MKKRFYELADQLFDSLADNEILCLYWSGENSDFIRLNHNQIRQAGNVRQAELQIDLVQNQEWGQRHATASFELGGDIDADYTQLLAILTQLRHQLPLLPEDPHLLLPDSVSNSNDETDKPLPETSEMVDALINASKGLDLVGLIASGASQRGYANSLGQRNWYSNNHFNLDWSCYGQSNTKASHDQQPQAVKSDYAGDHWEIAQLQQHCELAREQLGLTSHPSITLPPGNYRAYLAPTALRELLDMMSWGGFGYKSQQTGESPLLKMSRGDARLHETVTLHEDTQHGISPPFSKTGFIKTPIVTLIEHGHYRDSLVGPRSAREYQQTVTGSEHPESLWMEPGTLPQDDILKTLDTGIYINQLWYCNFSNRAECQITGMTRFACFWVEHGEIQAPIAPMRFDDSIYRLLGSELLALTRERQTLIDSSSYNERSTSSYCLPGALVKQLRFTL